MSRAVRIPLASPRELPRDSRLANSHSAATAPATGAVTLDVPEEFPTEDAVSVVEPAKVRW